MKYKEPEELNNSTPDWFKEWHRGTFWHFKYTVENKLATHDKVLWITVGAVIAGAIANVIFG